MELLKQAREKSAKLAEEARMAALEAAAKEASEKEAARLREKAISEIDQRGALALSKLSSAEERGQIKHHKLPTNEFHSEKQKGGKLSGTSLLTGNSLCFTIAFSNNCRLICYSCSTILC